MDLFKLADFKVFDIQDFNQRMAAIRTRIRPKLTSIGQGVAPKLSQLVDRPLHVHVARHARRTVNAPDDTWAAFGNSPRGYKKDVHFKIAISRHCVRLLFEAGPEYYAKTEWVRGWYGEFAEVVNDLRSHKTLAWFSNEHDEDPAFQLAAVAPAEIKRLPEELTRRKDGRGQFVLGARVDAKDFLRLTPRQVENLAVKTFEPLAPLFHIHKARVLVRN
jgi:uncharacterized protein YktB (UPF0637 family)